VHNYSRVISRFWDIRLSFHVMTSLAFKYGVTQSTTEKWPFVRRKQHQKQRQSINSTTAEGASWARAQIIRPPRPIRLSQPQQQSSRIQRRVTYDIARAFTRRKCPRARATDRSIAPNFLPCTHKHTAASSSTTRRKRGQLIDCLLTVRINFRRRYKRRQAP